MALPKKQAQRAGFTQKNGLAIFVYALLAVGIIYFTDWLLGIWQVPQDWHTPISVAAGIIFSFVLVNGLTKRIAGVEPKPLEI